jgi:hypothetical protein
MLEECLKRDHMGVDDFLDAEVGVAVALTAAVLQPSVRRVLRRGAVYGLAGLLITRDAVASFGRGVARGAQAVTSSAEQEIEDISADAEALRQRDQTAR